MRILTSFILVIFVWILVVGAIFFLIRFSIGITQYFISKPKIYVGVFTQDGKTNDKLSSMFFDRTQMYRARRNEDSEQKPFIYESVADSIMMEIGGRTQNELEQGPVPTLADKIELKISGVDVSALIRLFEKVVGRRYKCLEGNFVTYSDRISFTLTYREPSKPSKSWQFVACYNGTKSANNSSELNRKIEELMDRGIFYFADCQSPKRKKKDDDAK